MYFTLVIPAYNCQDTIDRLMQSIVEQHFDDLKIIIIDDSDEQHKGLEEKYINKYKKYLNIDYHIRWAEPPRWVGSYTCHCPGNTRHNGLYYALKEDTEYIFFADCDDEFEPNTFEIVANKIKELNQQFGYSLQTILTPFYRWKESTMTTISLEKKNIGWLHGKFYNKDFLIRNNIQFKPNLASHEDVFFNTMVNSALVKENSDFLVFEQIVYKWYHREDSESHREASLTGQNFLEKHFKDYIEAVTSPIVQIALTDSEHLQQHGINLINGIITSYFYFQGFLNNGNIDYFKINYEYCKWQVLQAIKVFHFNIETLIAMIQDQKEIYGIDREECIKGVGAFIEKQSIADYLRDMKFYV